MKLVGANPGSHAVGLDKQAGVSNYLIGNDPSKWHTDIANYAEVAYNGVYRGINLVYHGDQQQLEYDFVVPPGASPGAIRLAFDGVRGNRLTPGATWCCTPPAETWSSTPRSSTRCQWRRARGGQPVRSRTRRPGGLPGRPLRPQQAAGDRPGPEPELLDLPRRQANDGGNAIAVDSSGNAYITGFTVRPISPPGPLQRSSAGGDDVFVTKLNPTGTALSTPLTWAAASRYRQCHRRGQRGQRLRDGLDDLGQLPDDEPPAGPPEGRRGRVLVEVESRGDGTRLLHLPRRQRPRPGYGIAVDGSGNAYVTGTTASTDFPTTPGAYQTANPGITVAFVAKVNATGSSLVYATYLGGKQWRRPRASPWTAPATPT